MQLHANGYEREYEWCRQHGYAYGCDRSARVNEYARGRVRGPPAHDLL